MQKIAKNSPSAHHRTTLPGYILATKVHIDNRKTRNVGNAQRDGRPAEHRWRPLFNAAEFGGRPLLDAVQ